jgi:hypothetical protein
VWKKKAPNPSGPGALSLFRAYTTSLISWMEGSRVKKALMSSVISFGITSSASNGSCKTRLVQKRIL